ncbi:MAG: hypothetical protein OEY96_06410 [Gammaproteobacteria bacterium]|nr:hypothetical protein [Gammaproteobacteria bacterium]
MNKELSQTLNQFMVSRFTLLDKMYKCAYEQALKEKQMRLNQDWQEWDELDEESRQYVWEYLDR